MAAMAPSPADAPERWLLVSVSTAGAAASLRVLVWRKLRSLGAVYVQQSVCLLPARRAVVREVTRLLDRVQREGGHSRSLSLRIDDPEQERALVAEFNAARDAEYAEVLDRVPAFHQELDSERAKGRATYAEVEESEADLERFRSWMAKIERRDYFGAAGAQPARDAVERCAAELEAFEHEALNRDARQAEPADTATPRRRRDLRAVE
jgi:hypothetical protein